jgi:hypothetical protein
MPAADYTPGGFCPHCGYPMDAGRCSECGQYSPAEALDSTQHRRRRKRRRRRAVLLAIVVLIGLAGWYGWTHTNPVRWMPNWALLWLQRCHSDWATGMLGMRFQYDELTPQQAARMFEQVFVAQPALDVLSPYPAGVASTARVKCSFPLGGPKVWSWPLYVDESQILVDGVQVAHETRPGLAGYGPFIDQIEFEVPALAPGEHEITVTSVIAVRNPDLQGTGLTAAHHTWNVESRGRVLVEDRAPATYVHFVSTPELELNIAALLRIPAERPPDRPLKPNEIGFAFENLPVAVVGELYARPSGDAEFKHLRPFLAFKEAPGIMGTRTSGSGVINLTDVPGILGATHVDLRIVPSAEQALMLRITEVFGGTIERLRVPLSTSAPATKSTP